MDFEAFPKIGRLKRDCVVTEKIDGSNAQIAIVPAVDYDNSIARVDGLSIFAGSRNRWLQPGKTTDNFGFAGWVVDNAAELVKLGEGRHYGEWWGLGIQRGYGLTERRLSLFNAFRWNDPAIRPSCCGVVPTLYSGPFCTDEIDAALWFLEVDGSAAKPGFMKPEGIIVYHTATRTSFKSTIEDDEQPKTLAEHFDRGIRTFNETMRDHDEDKRLAA